MKLAYWMYAGPAHIGTLRVASSFKNVHAIMHAPLGDDYFNVMRSMLERERDFTPVTASIVDRHVLARGSQEKVIENIIRKDVEENPDLILLTPTCTSSILQEDLQNFAQRATLESNCDVLLADVNHYRVNEFQAADRTLEQVIRFYCPPPGNRSLNSNGYLRAAKGYLHGVQASSQANTSPALHADTPHGTYRAKTKKPSANILGMFTLGFHHQHDCRELKRLLYELGIETHLIVPEGGSVKDLKYLPDAWFNIVPYREIGCMSAQYLEREYQMPYVSITPMGVLDTAAFIRQIESIVNNFILNGPGEVEETQHKLTSDCIECRTSSENGKRYNYESYIERQTRFVSEASWFSRSIDCQNLTGKKTVVFGDATHAAAMTRILSREMGIRVSCAGTYCKHDSDWFREQVSGYCDTVLITDDHTQVSDMIARVEPAAIFGTQMERHIGKKLGIPCGVISAPVHIQNFPLSYRPFLGYEGTNQIADLVYNSFTLGMEDHLLEIFGGHDTNTSSISPSGVSPSVGLEPNKGASFEHGNLTLTTDSPAAVLTELTWSLEANAELQRIPGFVRGKVKRRVEKFAVQENISTILVSTMYAAKESGID